MAITHLTGSGQITIPVELRRKLGMDTGSAMYWSVDGQGRLIGRPIPQTLDELYGSFPARPGVRTEGDFDDLIEEAFDDGMARMIAEDRAEHGSE
ncbi:MAG: AbrB/MazE/SpoVT family DNA-binding domain-containing protein [Chloroflexia bacterium]|nr:AbrB/MazE/SpoVT family DNA-binding domain-containing protein [Chloroflexia bacterium]